MSKNALINNFAIRSFRDVADYDYISARMGYRARLVPQFLWSSLQAVEKYLKCILLLNRIKATQIWHELGAAVNLIDRQAPFEFRINGPSRKFIEYLDTYGRFRYFETPYYVKGMKSAELDMTVWAVRRYCKVIDYSKRDKNGKEKSMLEFELKKIERSEIEPYHAFKLPGGAIEKILKDKFHPAREHLIWQNLFFGSRSRKTARVPAMFESSNSPLSLHPEILGDVLQYVRLPKDVVSAYSEELAKRSRGRSETKT